MFSTVTIWLTSGTGHYLAHDILILKHYQRSIMLSGSFLAAITGKLLLQENLVKPSGYNDTELTPEQGLSNP